jgi:glucose/arabinose dehydrogenase
MPIKVGSATGVGNSAARAESRYAWFANLDHDHADPSNNGMFVGQHGSWNRSPRSGYKVIFVPFSQGRPSGQPIDVLTGFLDDEGHGRGRPVGLAIERARGRR